MDTVTLIMLISATISVLLWIIIFLYGYGEYDDIINASSLSVYKFREIFFIGFALMKILHIDIRSEKFSLKRERAAELYGPECAEYYTYITEGAQITYAATLFPIALLAGVFSESTVVAAAGVAVSALMLVYYDQEMKKKVNERREVLLCELPDMISRLALLINAGMVLREAWNTVADSSDTVLCTEMRRTSVDIRNGISESDAFYAFADRCRTKEVRKFISTLDQNLLKGSRELSISLKAMAAEQWEEKKNMVKRKSDAAERNLLFPMLIIFAAVITMVVVPVFTNMI